MIIVLSQAEFVHANKTSPYGPIRLPAAEHIARGELLERRFAVLGLDSPNRFADITLWPFFVTV